MPEIKARINRMGIRIQETIISRPITKTTSSIASPKLIKTILKHRPITLEKILDTKVSAYLEILNPLP